MNINNRRLLEILSIIEPSNSKNLYDVGCDHGILSISAYKKGIRKYIVLSDNKKGPLEFAKDNLKKYGISEDNKVILSNGIEHCKNEHVDTLVIAGIGNKTIYTQILNNISEYDIDEIIIQNDCVDISQITLLLKENSYKIVLRKAIYFKKIYYFTTLFSKIA